MLGEVEVHIADVPDVLGVEVGAVGIADENGRQQPREKQAVFQHHAGLLAAVFEDVVAGNHDDQARERRGERPVGKVELLHADGAVGLERENDDHHHGDHVDDEEDIGIDVREGIPDGI